MDGKMAGTDHLVHVKGNSAIVKEVNHHLSPLQLQEAHLSSHHFTQNCNLHRIPQGFRWLLCCVSSIICIIIKARTECKAVAQQLLPECSSDTFFSFVLKDAEVFCLQQVSGKRVHPFFCPQNEQPPEIHLMDNNGDLKMSVNGPDTLQSLKHKDLPSSSLLNELKDQQPTVTRLLRPDGSHDKGGTQTVL